MANYSWNSDLSKYEYSSYTGPHTKSIHRHLTDLELENIKIRHLELIYDSLNIMIGHLSAVLRIQSGDFDAK